MQYRTQRASIRIRTTADHFIVVHAELSGMRNHSETGRALSTRETHKGSYQKENSSRLSFLLLYLQDGLHTGIPTWNAKSCHLSELPAFLTIDRPLLQSAPEARQGDKKEPTRGKRIEQWTNWESNPRPDPGQTRISEGATTAKDPSYH